METYGYVEGYSFTDLILYCPACGSEIHSRFSDGTCRCSECGIRFGVVEKDEDTEEALERMNK